MTTFPTNNIYKKYADVIISNFQVHSVFILNKHHTKQKFWPDILIFVYTCSSLNTKVSWKRIQWILTNLYWKNIEFKNWAGVGVACKRKGRSEDEGREQVHAKDLRQRVHVVLIKTKETKQCIGTVKFSDDKG